MMMMHLEMKELRTLILLEKENSCHQMRDGTHKMASKSLPMLEESMHIV